MTNGTDEDDPRDRLDELRERIRSGDLSAVERDQLDQLVFVVVLAERRAETAVRDFPGEVAMQRALAAEGVGAGLNSATHHGGVEHVELTEPFATLLADTSREAMGRAQDAPDAPGTVEATDPHRSSRPATPAATRARTGTVRRTCWSGHTKVITNPR